MDPPYKSYTAESKPMVAVVNDGVSSTKAVEMLRELVRRMSLHQLSMLVCWLCGVIVRQGVDAI